MKLQWDIRKAPQHSYLMNGDDLILEVTPECLPSKEMQRLLAATPELLKFAKLFVGNPSEPRLSSDHLREIAIAIIAKAEGRK